MKDTIKASIKTLARRAADSDQVEFAQSLSQAALNLSATLAQLASIELTEAHIEADRRANEAAEGGEATGPQIH